MNTDLPTRRNFLLGGMALLAAPLASHLNAAGTTEGAPVKATPAHAPLSIHYLEMVVQNSEALCELYRAIHGVTFSEAVPVLGGARTAQLPGGPLLGVRAPMHGAEKPVTRPYFLVADIQAAVAAAKKAGAEIAVPPMEIPGYGKCAIFLSQGIETGLWQT